jgi:CheY-like chemotaxis protein
MSRDGRERRLVALLVEDNRADVFLVQQAIQIHQLELDLHVVSDGDQACEFIERAENDLEPAPCPELVLLDLNLPRRSAKEVLKRLRQSPRCSTVPVVIITSSDLSNDRKELFALGANRYFRKPS